MYEIKPEIKEIKPEIMPVVEEKKYLKVTLDLGIKRDNKELRLPGDFILIDKIDGALEVRLDKPTNDPIDFQRIKVIRSPFETMYLTNAAQAGRSAVLYVGREASFESEPLVIGKVEVVTPATVRTGLIKMITAASGGEVLHSGSVLSVNIRSLSGDICIGGATDRPVVVSGFPFSSIGFLLKAGEVKSMDIDNFNKIYLCSQKSGDAVSFLGVG